MRNPRTKKMTNEDIKELIQMVVESGVAELEVERGDNKVRIRRTAGVATEVVLPAVAAPNPAAPAPAPAPAAAAAAPEPVDVMSDPTLFIQKSPIVGTFYEAPKPGAPPFVRVGERVEKGRVLCIIESMKLMNEIEADEAGLIVAKFVENGKPVEYGEALFAIKPD
jgi:acetyl-CoA carboxylase biotin carboxyl carrier protein